MKFLLLIISLFTCFAVAQEKKTEGILNKLFAPGPVIEGHKNLEATGCLDCHDAGKGVPSDKCLNCHKDIQVFVNENRGFHGLQKQSCFECHSDHKGRDYDTTKIDINTFDHSLTGYKLVGEHQNIDCKDCHKEKRSQKHLRKNDPKFLGLATSCKECHKKDDKHHFKGKYAKQDCNQCHGMNKWTSEIKFNHNKDTQFVLSGNHSKLKCVDCHFDKRTKKTNYQWKNLKKDQCLSCHADHHKNNLSSKFRGGNCKQCHSEQTWKIAKFNHKITSYPLKGKHAAINCLECHKQNSTKSKNNLQWVGLNSQCTTCHTDYHKYGGRKSKKLGDLNKCESCHSEESWKKTHSFNHNKDTGYPITGKHLELKCNECHKPISTKNKKIMMRQYEWVHLNTKTCENCHKSPHTKKFSPKFLKKKCTECHVSSGWNNKPNYSKDFKHSETRFPLTGKHTKLKCSECHSISGNQVFQFKSSDKKFCIDCHDNPHLNQFHKNTSEQSCANCHNTNQFKNVSQFDHNQSEFKLKGKHMTLNCLECHTPSKEILSRAKKQPKVFHKFVFDNLGEEGCTTCHQDYHKGQFKKDCSQCHNEKSWRKVQFNHNKDTDFPLVFKHEKVKCNKCHISDKKNLVKFGKPEKNYPLRIYKLGDPNCYTCHKKDDTHKGQFGSDCNQCHLERGWKYTKDFHRDYTLHGAHFTAECKECHVDNRKLSGMSDNCIYCHQKDDIHSGSLPACNNCHVQQFWEHAKFRHSLTFFPLRGAHRTLDCFSCHQQNRYEGTTTSCYGCHTQEFNSMISDPDVPHLPSMQSCEECHNQFTWPGAR